MANWPLGCRRRSSALSLTRERGAACHIAWRPPRPLSESRVGCRSAAERDQSAWAGGEGENYMDPCLWTNYRADEERRAAGKEGGYDGRGKKEGQHVEQDERVVVATVTGKP